ncbi:putative sodium-coupled neutral amino acid transporter 11 isoform X2 [Oscarella lobularis]|uniref:putative sodium-coupled neutral amino acid transporter 11 isoform X2 n=1 Tax=Oscarella lobularis TaxID=121494 RepID=UPI003313D255
MDKNDKGIVHYETGEDQVKMSLSLTDDDTEDRGLLDKENEGPPHYTRSQLMGNESKAVFNFINSIIGAGIIGIPFALHEAGFILGVLLLTLVGIVTDYSILLLVKSGKIAGMDTYQDLMRKTFGKVGFYYLSAIQFLFPFLAMSGYVVIVGDNIPKVLELIPQLRGTVLTEPHFIKFLVVIVVMLPLSLYRNISNLGKVSLVSLVCVVFILIVIWVRFFSLGPDVPVTCDTYSFANKGVAQAIGIMATTYVCHHNTFLIFDSLHYVSLHKFTRVTHTSVFISWLTVVLLGVGGYLTFKGNTQGDLLINYCPDDEVINAARFIYTVTIMLTFPIECFVAREVIENLYLTFFKGKANETLLWHVVVTCLISFGALGVGETTDNLGFVLELNGVLAATPLAFILPAACYLKLAEGKIVSKKKIWALLLLIFGFIVMIIGTVMSILSIVENPRTCDTWRYCNASLVSFNGTVDQCMENRNETSFYAC